MKFKEFSLLSRSQKEEWGFRFRDKYFESFTLSSLSWVCVSFLAIVTMVYALVSTGEMSDKLWLSFELFLDVFRLLILVAIGEICFKIGWNIILKYLERSWFKKCLGVRK